MKKCKGKDLIWHMVGEMVKKLGWGRLLISCNYSCTFYSLVKILLVKLKNLHTSACLQLNCCTTKYKPKMWRLQIWWNSSKLVTNTLVNFDNFFNYIILSSIFLLRKKHLQKMMFGKNGQFPFAWGIMIKTWRRVLLGGMSKIEQIQFFDSQMYLQ